MTWDDVQLVALCVALVSLVWLLVSWCGRPITPTEAARRGVVGVIVDEPRPSGLPYTWGEFARDTRDPNVSLDYIAQRCYDAGGVPQRVSSAPSSPPRPTAGAAGENASSASCAASAVGLPDSVSLLLAVGTAAFLSPLIWKHLKK